MKFQLASGEPLPRSEFAQQGGDSNPYRRSLGHTGCREDEDQNDQCGQTSDLNKKWHFGPAQGVFPARLPGLQLLRRCPDMFNDDPIHRNLLLPQLFRRQPERNTAQQVTANTTVSTPAAAPPISRLLSA